jgi:diguanylate cyclase (GGDEF)-like protein
MLRRRAEEAGPATDGLEVEEEAGPATDPLTGALERGEWLEIVRAMHKRAEHDNQRFAVFFVRLDGLDDLNDLFGPEDADLALQTIAERLQRALGDQVPVARWAGAEFGLAWPGVTTVEAGARVCTELATMLAEPAQLATSTQALRTRIGGALYDPAYAGSRAMVDDAHAALVEAAARSDRTPVVRDESTRNRLTLRVDPARLQEALTRSEYRLVWQPVVDLATGNTVGVEALLRWEDSRSGTHLIPAPEFLPMLERTGFIVEVGAWVVREASAQVRAWNEQRAGRDPLFVSVNLGGRQIEDPAFAERVVRALDETGLAPELLCLDITDTCLAVAGTDTWTYLRPLKMLGVQLALNGLGVGATAVSYLRELQLDLVRIDQTFLNDIVTSPDDQTITGALLSMVHGLGLRAVAQGIESPDQANTLSAMGCDLAQGNHFGKPLLANELGVPG